MGLGVRLVVVAITANGQPAHHFGSRRRRSSR
jgi:hypothetical protein